MPSKEKPSTETDNGRPVRLIDIADRCGLSMITVSRALRGHPKAAKQTRELVEKVAAEMGYDPSRNSAARRMALSKTGRHEVNQAIAFLFNLSISRTTYFNLIFEGILTASLEEDFQVMNTDLWRHFVTARPPILFRKGDIDGALVLGHDSDVWRENLGYMRAERGFGQRPVIGLIEHFDGCSGVYPDYFDAAHQLMSHLLDLGHRDIMLTSPYAQTKTKVTVLQSAAYERAYEERDLSAHGHLFYIDWNDDACEISASHMVAELRNRPEITAIVARNDLVANSVYTGLVQANIEVPKDISLISYDDTNALLDSGRENILTTVRVPLYDVGFESTKMLIRRIRGEETEDRDVMLPVKLIVRGSTAPPRRK